MKAAQRLKSIVAFFSENNPFPETELHYKSEYELCVAVILSAQCTDKRVNMITPGFFDAFPDFPSLSAASQDEVLEKIRSCSYPNNKATHLRKLAIELCSHFHGKLPGDIETLMTLPGIGRKTANVLLSVLAQANVFAVDTHVFRVTHRIGLVTAEAKTPLAVEKEITRLSDKDVPLHQLHHWLILHGRYICTARNPKCNDCPIREYCRYYSALSGKKKPSM